MQDVGGRGANASADPLPGHGIIAVDSGGRVRACNDICAALLGFSTGELIGASIAALLPQELQKDGSSPLAGNIEDGPLESKSVKARRKDRSNIVLCLGESGGVLDGQDVRFGLLRDDAKADDVHARFDAQTQSILETFSDAVVTVDEFGLGGFLQQRRLAALRL